MPGRGWYLIGVGIGLVAAGGAGFLTFSTLFRRVDAMQRVVVPGRHELDLPAGEQKIFFESRSTVSGERFDVDSFSGLRCGLATADGTAVKLEEPTARTTYTLGSRSGSSFLEFVAPAAGAYVFECGYDGDGPRIVLAFGQGIGMLIVVGIFGILGGLALGVLVCVIVAVKRRRARRAQPVAI